MHSWTWRKFERATTQYHLKSQFNIKALLAYNNIFYFLFLNLSWPLYSCYFTVVTLQFTSLSAFIRNDKHRIIYCQIVIQNSDNSWSLLLKKLKELQWGVDHSETRGTSEQPYSLKVKVKTVQKDNCRNRILCVFNIHSLLNH